MSIPAQLKYTKDHEWLGAAGGPDEVMVGITAHAQEQLGDVVFVELPQVGSKVVAGQAFGTVESVKAVSDLFAPVSGEVVAINEALRQEPESVNQDPYGKGWMIKVKLAAPQELEALLAAPAYAELVAAGH